MRFTRVKKTRDIQLPGIRVDLDIGDGNVIHRMTLRREVTGEPLLLVRQAGYGNGISLEIPAPPKTKTVHTLRWKILDQDFSRDYDDEYQAEAALHELPVAVQQDAKVEPTEVIDPEDLA